MAIRIESQELRVFHTVYTEGGFSRAADKLHVTQSAVSQTIANLEHKLECVLFQRSPLQLTEAGIRVLDYAASVLGEEQTLLDDLRNITRGVQKHLNIGVNATVAQLYGETLLSEFSQSDETRLQVTVLPSRRLFTAIASDQIELGFGPFQQTMPARLRAIPLFEDERSLVIHESHPTREESIPDPDLLRKVPLIVSHLDDPVERPADVKLRDAFGTIWEVTDLALRLHLVRQGRAMTYLDHRLMATLPDHNTLITLDELAFGRIPLTWGIFHKKDKPLSRGAIEFIEYCRSLDFE